MKLKYRKQFFRAISLLLIIALLCPISLNTVAIRANAVENVTEEKSAVKEDAITETVSLGDTLEVPGFVSQAQIEERGHVSRLIGEESLNTLVYLNRDGTKTKYIMDYPVKYIDENGDTKFVDLSLGETTTAFETTANDIVLSVSKDYTKGITLTYKDYTVSLVAVPNSNRAESGSISTAPITVAAKNNNAITYNDVFATDIDIRYSPLHNGVKEDIILQTYNGTNTFHFLLSTSGLGVYSEKDNYYLAEAANADMRMDLGKVIVYDANRKISEGSLTVTTLKEKQLYQVTVSVDQAFLADPNTVYPVQIDPSITVSDTTHGANAVTDCPVYSGKPTFNMGTALYNPIGYLDSAYQIGRTAVKLVGLANDPVYQGLSAAQIQSAYFYIKDSSGTAAKSINLYALTSNSTWTESSLTWNTLGTISSTLQASANVGGAAWSSFNITNLVKGWKNGSYNINCGFILQSSNESVAGNFFSSEAAESNWPYLVLNYTVGTSSITLSSTSASIVEGGTRTLVATTNPAGQTVTWSTSNSAVATVSSSGVVTAKKAGTATITARMVDPDGITRTATCIVYVYIPNGVYYIKNMNSNYYLHVKNGGAENFTDVCQYLKYSSSSSELNQIRQMWKLFYLGDGRYSIRPMNRLSMGLDITSGNVDIFHIGTNDTLSGVATYARWSIEWYSTGYVFKGNGNNNSTMQINNASTGLSATVSASTYSTALNCRWELAPVTSAPSGVYWYDTLNDKAISATHFADLKYVTYNNPQKSDSMGLIAISYSPTSINQSFTWTSQNTSHVTVNSTSGLMTGNNSGKTRISARKTVNGTSYTLTFDIMSIGADQYNAGVRIATVNGKQYYDYTIPVNSLFASAVALCDGSRCMTWEQYCVFLNDYDPSLEPNPVEHAALQLFSLLWFYQHVNHNAVWDIKREARWSDALPDVPYLREDDGDFIDFVFRGSVTTAEGLGNIMYGYTGRATGFGETTLYWGGGVAAQGSMSCDEVTTPPYYGDTEEDHNNIKIGFDMFNEDYPNYPEIAFDGIPIGGWLADIGDVLLNPGT